MAGRLLRRKNGSGTVYSALKWCGFQKMFKLFFPAASLYIFFWSFHGIIKMALHLKQ
jgi:hypothetical protein